VTFRERCNYLPLKTVTKLKILSELESRSLNIVEMVETLRGDNLGSVRAIGIQREECEGLRGGDWGSQNKTSSVSLS